MSQYGSKYGKLCHSQICNKALTYYIFRTIKENGNCVEFDTVANYNHIIPSLVVLACSCLGLGGVPGKMILDDFEGMIHMVSHNN